MRENDPESFFYKYFRMTPEQFYHLLFLVGLFLTVNLPISKRVGPKHMAKLSYDKIQIYDWSNIAENKKVT